MDGSRYSARSRSRDRVDRDRRRGNDERYKRSRSRSVERSSNRDREGRSSRRSRSRSPIKYKRSYSRSPEALEFRREKDYPDIKRPFEDRKERDYRFEKEKSTNFRDNIRSNNYSNNNLYGKGDEKLKDREKDSKPADRRVRDVVDDTLKRVKYDENSNKNTATVSVQDSKVVVPVSNNENAKSVSDTNDGETKKVSGTQSPSYDDEDLQDIENFLEFGMSAQELQQREAEKLAADRKRRAEQIANKYKQQSSPKAATSSVSIPVVSVDQIAPTSTATATTTINAVSSADGDSNLNILDDLPIETNTQFQKKRLLSSVNAVSSSQDEHSNLSTAEDSKLLTQASITRVMSLENLALEDASHNANLLIGSAPEINAIDLEAIHLATERSAIEAEEKANKQFKNFAFDIFSTSPSDLEMNRKIPANGTAKGAAAVPRVESGTEEHLQSNWDDGDGYYKARIGEVICDRYQTLGVVGKGVFSSVLKCYDLKTGDGTNVVALKLIRNNDTMRKAAEKERSILLKMLENDPENKRYCVKLLSHMDYRNHVALVFEFQTMNLRETLKKFGKDVGINIGAVRMYGKQLMVALRFLMELKIVHADIKLDNILCSGDLKQIKLCDFGSAFYEDDVDNVPTPYLVSRFYRAPEIILGFQYDRAIDLWSVCVCLYELFTGHVMFPGRTNNEMLRLFMAVKGRFPNKIIKSHLRAYEAMSLEAHFDGDGRYKQYEADPITGKPILRLVDVNNPTRDLSSVLRSSKAGADDIKLVTQLCDLLEKGLALDASKRLTVSDALRHPFFNAK